MIELFWVVFTLFIRYDKYKLKNTTFVNKIKGKLRDFIAFLNILYNFSLLKNRNVMKYPGNYYRKGQKIAGSFLLRRHFCPKKTMAKVHDKHVSAETLKKFEGRRHIKTYLLSI